MARTTERGVKQDEAMKSLQELAKKIDIAMLTTECDGRLRSRPMSTNGEVEFDGDLWFFTDASAHKVEEIEQAPHVNVAFADPRNHIYISMSGSALIVRDPERIRELWRPNLKVWFPDGPDKHDIALLKVQVDYAEYWDGSKNALTQAVQVAKSLMEKQRPDLGEHRKLPMQGRMH